MQYNSIREKFERMIELSKTEKRVPGLFETAEEVQQWGDRLAEINAPIFDRFDRCHRGSRDAAQRKWVK